MWQMVRVMGTCLALLTALLVCYGSAQGILVSGTVADTDSEVVVGAQVTFTAEADSNLVFTATTGTDGSYEVVLPAQVAVEEETKGQAVPNDFELFQNYPNPFNPSTVIAYTLAKRTEVELTIYNILGQRVRTLVQKVQDAGSYVAAWDGRDDQGVGLAAGVYIYRLRCGAFVQARKMVMMDGINSAPVDMGRLGPSKIASSAKRTVSALNYMVEVSGENIVTYSQSGIVISRDMAIKFSVFRTLQLPTVATVDENGEAQAQTNTEGEVSVESPTFSQGVRFALKDQSGTPIESIRMEYQEAENLAVARFRDPTGRFRETVFWGDPSTFGISSSKAMLKPTIDPFTIGLVLAFTGGFFATSASYDLTDAIQEIDTILDEEALNKIRAQGDPACLTMESVVKLIQTRFKGQKGALTLAFAPAGAKATVTSLVIEAGKFSLDKGTDFLIDYVGKEKAEEWGAIDKNTVFTVRMNNWGSFLPGVVGGLDISVDSYCVGGQPPTGEMALIPAGSFQMGDHFNEGRSYERPVHTVYVDAFYMDKYEITNAQYCVFLNEQGNQTEGGCTWLDINSSYCLITKSSGEFVPKSGYEDHPVIEVTWYGASAYAEWAGKRLPTEAEWEKAARGGLLGKRYPWGDEISHDDANYSRRGGRDQWSRTSPVGSFPPNDYELYDMAGNVWEWCSDWYDSGYYSRSPENNPTGPQTGSYRVVRGGSWSHSPAYMRCAYRGFNYPIRSFDAFGFRCVRVP